MADDSVASGRRNAKGQFTKGSNVPAEGGGTDEKVLSALAGINSSIMNSVSINTKTFQRVTNLYDETKNQSTIMKDIADGIAKVIEGSQPSARETATKGLSEDSKPSGDGGDEGKVQKEASKEVSKGFKGFFGRFLKIFGLLSIGAFFKDEISGFIKGAFGQLKTFVADWWAGVLPELQNFGKALLGDKFYEFLFGKEGEKGLFSTAADEIGKFYTANIKPLFDKIANSEMFKSFMGYVEGLGKALKGVGVAMGIINDDGTLTSGGVLTGIAAFSAIFAVGGPMALLQTALLPIKLITGAFGILASIGKGLAGIAWTAVSKGFGAIMSMGKVGGGALKGLGGLLKSPALLGALKGALPVLIPALIVAGAFAGLSAWAKGMREDQAKKDVVREGADEAGQAVADTQQVGIDYLETEAAQAAGVKKGDTLAVAEEKITAAKASGALDEGGAEAAQAELKEEVKRTGGAAIRMMYTMQAESIKKLNDMMRFGMVQHKDGPGGVQPAITMLGEWALSQKDDPQPITKEVLAQFGLTIGKPKKGEELTAAMNLLSSDLSITDRMKRQNQIMAGEYDVGAEMEKLGGLTGLLTSKEGFGGGSKTLTRIRSTAGETQEGDVSAGRGRFVVNQESLQAYIKQKNLESQQKKLRENEGDGGAAGDTINIAPGASGGGASATEQPPGGKTEVTARLAKTKMRTDASGKFVYGAAAGL